MGTTTPKSLKVALIFVMSPVILFVIDSLGCVCVGGGCEWCAVP